MHVESLCVRRVRPVLSRSVLLDGWQTESVARRCLTVSPSRADLRVTHATGSKVWAR
jgi:hypothetical protein